jgi:hypothetical protein
MRFSLGAHRWRERRGIIAEAEIRCDSEIECDGSRGFLVGAGARRR